MSSGGLRRTWGPGWRTGGLADSAWRTGGFLADFWRTSGGLLADSGGLLADCWRTVGGLRRLGRLVGARSWRWRPGPPCPRGGSPVSRQRAAAEGWTNPRGEHRRRGAREVVAYADDMLGRWSPDPPTPPRPPARRQRQRRQQRRQQQRRRRNPKACSGPAPIPVPPAGHTPTMQVKVQGHTPGRRGHGREAAVVAAADEWRRGTCSTSSRRSPRCPPSRAHARRAGLRTPPQAGGGREAAVAAVADWCGRSTPSQAGWRAGGGVLRAGGGGRRHRGGAREVVAFACEFSSPGRRGSRPAGGCELLHHAVHRSPPSSAFPTVSTCP
eukprot:gene18055-biopygen6428